MPLKTLNSDHTHPELLDTLWDYQNKNGFIRDRDVTECACKMGMSEIELEGVISFYHFFHRRTPGKYVIYLNNSIVSEFKGFHRVKEAFERETGARCGSVDMSGHFGLYETACIGLSDQEPSALINFRPFTNLNTLKVRKIIAKLKQGISLDEVCDQVNDNVRYMPDDKKSIFFREYLPGSSIAKMKEMSPEAVLEEITKSKLSGRGGAFFPTGLKWSFCKQQKATPKYIVCNADEGEPGTFKDRVLMNALPGLVLEGMIISAYVVGASEGILYLRAEYMWIRDKLQKEIERFRRMELLGKDIAGIKGFYFDIRIQMGAGSYVVGEETAMLNSMEGKRGESRIKKYFPVERGFLQKPTVVNNVETLCAASRIIELGADHYLKTGTKASPGTKVISVSGDCHIPGIYEIEYGMKVSELLDLCEADDPYFLQISGPSGQCISMKEKDRKISKDDLPCGGSFMIFNSQRDILQILLNYTSFFKEESCGVCTPCRAGNFIMQRRLEKIKAGLALEQDYKEIRQWSEIMKVTSRCGLGKTATNSLIKALDAFPQFFEIKVEEALNKEFDLIKATEEYEKFKS